MRQHRRVIPCAEARLELTRALIEIERRHELTALETIRLLSENIATITRYAIRDERHPSNPDKPGDEA